MILLILSVLSSLSSLSCFQNHSDNVHQLYLVFSVLFGYDWWLSYCEFSVPFSFSLCFVHFFLYENDYFSCDMLQRKHIQVLRPQTSHSVPSVPLFFLFFFLFPSFFFFFFFFLFFFFCPTGEKKKIIFFFLSCSCSGPKSRWSAEQCQTCRRQPGTPAFCLYLSKGFCFCSSILFSLTVLKVKEWLPFPPAPTRLQPDSNAFVPTSFFLGLLASGFLDLLFFRLWKPKVLSILGGMLCCWFFILWLGVRFLYNSCFAFFLGFCDTTLLIPLVDFDGCLRGSVWRPSSHGWLARPRSHRPCFLTFYKPSNSTALCFSANVINDCKLWQTVFLFLKICMS